VAKKVDRYAPALTSLELDVLRAAARPTMPMNRQEREACELLTTLKFLEQELGRDAYRRTELGEAVLTRWVRAGWAPPTRGAETKGRR